VGLLLVSQGFGVHRGRMMPSQRESSARELSNVRRVLIVDDQQDAAELMASVLEDLGHEVKIALDGESALVLASEFRPQVALLDIGLPVMSGHQLAALMRATPRLAACRLIAVSGHCNEHDRAQSKAAGFERHLAKPLSIEALLSAIDSGGPEHAERLA
jgi:two-component system, sensor histidine kinase